MKKIEVMLPPAGTKFVCEIPAGYSGADLMLYCHANKIEPDIILANSELPAIKYNRDSKKWENLLNA